MNFEKHLLKRSNYENYRRLLSSGCLSYARFFRHLIRSGSLSVRMGYAKRRSHLWRQCCTCTVSNYNDLKSALTSSSNKVVYISGTINILWRKNYYSGPGGKSIIGLPGSKLVSSDMTASGSGIFYIKCSNFIMRNLILEGPSAYDTDGYDNLCIDACTNFCWSLWVSWWVGWKLDIKNAWFHLCNLVYFQLRKPPKWRIRWFNHLD